MLDVNRLRRLLDPQRLKRERQQGPIAATVTACGKSKAAVTVESQPQPPPAKKRKKSQKASAAALTKKTQDEAPSAGAAATPEAEDSTVAEPPARKKRHRRKLSQRRQLAQQTAAAAAAAASGGKAKGVGIVPAAGDQLLLASKFRFLNEQLYTLKSSEAFEMFQADPEAFKIYHSGYESQRAKWSEDPLDWVAKQCRACLPPDASGALVDFGCGDARLAERLADACRRIHSLDLVALNPRVTACDMAHCPLADRCAHAAVFCLSLMNANLADFLAEASRVLKPRGHLCIVEARSRVERTQRFVNLVERFGFEGVSRREDKYLVYLMFAKSRQRKPGEPLPEIRLKPCLYKKR